MLLNRYGTPEDQLKAIPGENAEFLIPEAFVHGGIISEGKSKS